MDNTPLLNLPLVMPSQAQPNITHNEALMVLDGITQLSAIDRFVTDPPVSPAQGDRYIVPGSATGDWTGLTGQIVMMRDGAWLAIVPGAGWRCWIEADNAELVFDGENWVDAATASVSLQNLEGIGIGGTYDETAPLVVHGPSSLFTGETGHQLKLNKPLDSDTGTVLFQTGYSGRAEFGTAGDDDFHVKVSADGSAWNEAMIVDASSGAVSFPNTQMQSGFRNLLINSRGLINQRGYTSAAVTSGADEYTVDRWRVVTSGQALSWSEANGYRTFTAPAGGVEQVIEGNNIVTGTHVLSWIGTATATVDGSPVSNGGTVALTGGTEVTVKFSGGTFALPQFERGDVASAFEVRPLAQELELCRYYFEVLGDGTVIHSGVIIGYMQSTTRGYFIVPFATKRANPTITVSAAADWLVNNQTINDAGTAFAVVTSTVQPDRALVYFDIATPRTAGNGCMLYGNSSVAKMFFDAEL